MNSVIQNLPNSANGDFALSAESGTVWMYETDWYNSGDVVPDQVTPASDTKPLSDGTATAGISTEYSRGNHVHPLQVSTALPVKDTANGEVGVATTYSRSDHTHHVNLSNDIPLKDTGTGTAGTANVYASTTHQHPLNVDPTTANVPLVNATAAANGGLATEILCAHGDTINGAVDIATDQTITGVKTIYNQITADGYKCFYRTK
ncbi:MAG: hypothetical protein EZS28_017888 [Streblomastix strix]|uniref:Uncharacterized protein n=1 Tax=Streblomastix strix TaxID=222440 RepID=A0A5J4VW73_9EUKA|nr:MAG: hypothetical protein EZS28_017888 [Streblomastix strix]